jgi:hypothetical protein
LEHRQRDISEIAKNAKAINVRTIPIISNFVALSGRKKMKRLRKNMQA